MTRLEALKDLQAKVKVGTLQAVDLVVLDAASHANAWKAYSGSLNAAKALHEAVLPGWHWIISPVGADVIRDEDSGDPLVQPYSWGGEIASRAWLLAIIDALIAEDAASAGKGDV